MKRTSTFKLSTCKTKGGKTNIKKVVHIHLYTQNNHENLLTDDKDASAKVYNFCEHIRIVKESNLRLPGTSFCNDSLPSSPVICAS